MGDIGLKIKDDPLDFIINKWGYALFLKYKNRDLAFFAMDVLRELLILRG